MQQTMLSAKVYSGFEVSVNTNDAIIKCRVMGSGEPLIIVHGGPGLSMNYLMPGLSNLATKHKLVFYDQRGSGESTGEITEKHMNLDTFIADLHGIVKHFKFKRVGLLGHSWGAYLALSYAIAEHVDITQLILLNPIPISGCTQHDDPYEGMIHRMLECNYTDKLSLLTILKSTFTQFMQHPDLFNKLGFQFMSAEALYQSALIHQVFEKNFFHQPHDLKPQLAKLSKIPQTIIAYGHSNDFPKSNAEEIQQSIDGSRVVELEAGHFAHIEAPEELIELITNLGSQEQRKLPEQESSNVIFN